MVLFLDPAADIERERLENVAPRTTGSAIPSSIAFVSVLL